MGGTVVKLFEDNLPELKDFPKFYLFETQDYFFGRRGYLVGKDLGEIKPGKRKVLVYTGEIPCPEIQFCEVSKEDLEIPNPVHLRNLEIQLGLSINGFKHFPEIGQTVEGNYENDGEKFSTTIIHDSKSIYTSCSRQVNNGPIELISRHHYDSKKPYFNDEPYFFIASEFQVSEVSNVDLLREWIMNFKVIKAFNE